jgi:hypothetical protein
MHFELAYLQRCNTDRRHGAVAIKAVSLCSVSLYQNHFCREKAISITYLCVCVCARAQVRKSCVHVEGWAGGCWCKSAGVCLRACSLPNPACNPPPYCHLQFLWLHHIFRHYLINGTIFQKTLLKIKCALIFSTGSGWNISHSKKNSARYCQM